MVAAASDDELRQHEAMLDLIDKASGGKSVWRVGNAPISPQIGDQTHRNH